MIEKYGRRENGPGRKKWIMTQMRDALITSRIICDEEINSIRTAIVSGSSAREEMFEQILQEYGARGRTREKSNEGRENPSQATENAPPTLPHVDIHNGEQVTARTMRTERIQTNERFRELARALGGQRVIVHAHCVPESANMGDHG